MNTLTLKIPESLDVALQAVSARRQMSKSAVVREALEKNLAEELRVSSASANWAEHWRGVLRDTDVAKQADERVVHILQKHLR